MRVGLHARNDASFSEADYRLLRAARVDTLKAMSHTEVAVFARLRAEFPDLELIVRLYDDRIGRDSRVTPQQFAERMVPIMRSLWPYAAKFEIHNEPNHCDGIEGWGPSDADAHDFLGWYMEALSKLRQAAPWASFGFPGLALNWPHRDLEWLAICRPAVLASDWLGCHCYWQYDNMLSDDWGLRFKLYHQRFPDKRIEVTEFGDSTPNLDPERMAAEYVAYYQELRKYPYLGSASAFIASSPDPAWVQFAWMDENANMRPVVFAVGNMERRPVIQIVDLCGQLPTNGSYPQRDLAEIRYTVLHHAVTPNQDSIGSRLRVRRIAEYHIRRWGWAGIGYHFVIDRDGMVYQTNPLTAVSNHAYRGNLHGVGVCLLGTYTKDNPPAAQAQAAAELVRHLGYPMREHRSFGGTACPGQAGAAVRSLLEV